MDSMWCSLNFRVIPEYGLTKLGSCKFAPPNFCFWQIQELHGWPQVFSIQYWPCNDIACKTTLSSWPEETESQLRSNIVSKVQHFSYSNLNGLTLNSGNSRIYCLIWNRIIQCDDPLVPSTGWYRQNRHWYVRLEARYGQDGYNWDFDCQYIQTINVIGEGIGQISTSRIQ